LGDDAEFYVYGTYANKNCPLLRELPAAEYYFLYGSCWRDEPYQYPYGFSPQEATHEIDYGLTSGGKGKMVGWNWDVSTTYGDDDVKLSTIHSGNIGLYAATGCLTGGLLRWPAEGDAVDVEPGPQPRL